MKKNTFPKSVALRVAALLQALLLTLSFCACKVIDDEERRNESDTVVITPGMTDADEPKGEQDERSAIKNVILIIGDGMGLEHISAAQMCTGAQFAFTEWQYFSVNTDSVNADGTGAILTDSAASGTALATGCLTVNGYVGKNTAGVDVPTVMDAARQLGKATGIVTTDSLYGATPAAFSAHAMSRSDYAEIVTSQLSSGVDLLCGDADALCIGQKEAIEAAGYRYCDTLAAATESVNALQAYWQLSLGGTQASVKLSEATAMALDFLSRDEDGFCLMIEQAHIDKYSHSNSFSEVVECVSDLNDTVNAVLAWLGDRTDTAIIVTADHETGGLSVSEQNRFAASFAGEKGSVYYEFSSRDHTNAYVGAFVFGVAVKPAKYSYGSPSLIKNADVYYVVCDIMNGQWES